MADVYIIHGWEGSPEEPLHKWLQNSLEKKGIATKALKMPNPEVPQIEEWKSKIQSEITFSEDTIVVAHSIGCQAILRSLEEQEGEIKIKGLVLLAPWMDLHREAILKEEGEEVLDIARPWIESPIDFQKVKERVNQVVTIFSDDDYYVPIDQEKIFNEALDAQSFVLSGYGHFTEEDGVEELPLLLNIVEELINK